MEGKGKEREGKRKGEGEGKGKEKGKGKGKGLIPTSQRPTNLESTSQVTYHRNNLVCKQDGLS